MSRRGLIRGRRGRSFLGVVTALSALLGCAPPSVDEVQPAEESRLGLTSLLAGESEGFARAIEPRTRPCLAM